MYKWIFYVTYCLIDLLVYINSIYIIYLLTQISTLCYSKCVFDYLFAIYRTKIPFHKSSLFIIAHMFDWHLYSYRLYEFTWLIIFICYQFYFTVHHRTVIAPFRIIPTIALSVIYISNLTISKNAQAHNAKTIKT